MSHTKGPWEAGVNPKGEYTNEVVVRPQGQFPHGEWIADCGPSTDKTVWANARLIAAAPDLLEALKIAQLWLDIDGRYDMQSINAAISKAIGAA